MSLQQYRGDEEPRKHKEKVHAEGRFQWKQRTEIVMVQDQ
jgi:hypothetical protein